MDEEKGDDGAEVVHSACEILDRLRKTADEHNEVSVGDVLDAIGDRSYGPALFIPALIEVTPVGGIPGVPTFLAVIIALTAAQLFFDREHLWLPSFIRNRTVSGARLHKSADKLDGIARKLDKWFHGRMPRFVKQPWPRIAAVAILVLCCTVPPLEFLPFASSAPMLAIAAFGLALLVRDGLLMLVALGFSIVSLALGANLLALGGVFESGSGESP